MRIANLGEPFWNCQHREVGRVAVGNLIPVKRRRDARVGDRPHRICRAGRAVLGVLVVVEEHAMPFFLPPFRSGNGGRAALAPPRQKQRRAAALVEGASLANPPGGVATSRSAWLWPAAEDHSI